MKRIRFAPSPTGFVHVGNARTAIFNYLYAKGSDGIYILRIEDTDRQRSKAEYEDHLIKDLKWLGISWDEDPVSGGEYGPYRQSERFEIYREHTTKLLRENKAYYCFCSEEDLEADKEAARKEGGNLVYSGKCRDIGPDTAAARVRNGERASVRFRSPSSGTVGFRDRVRGNVAVDPALLGDMIIVRSNGIPAYNFAVVVDDHLMQIDLVIRGEDHLSNTFKQVMMFEAFGFRTPEFAHLSMVMGEDNAKLSKRHGSVSISEFREKGYLPEALFNYLSLLGWSPGDNREIFSRDELIRAFDLGRVIKSASIFDYNKLKWMNREHIRMLDPVDLIERVIPFLKKTGFVFENTGPVSSWIGRTARILSDYENTLEGIASLFSQFHTPGISSGILTELAGNPSSVEVISLLLNEMKRLTSPVPAEKVLEIIKDIQKRTGVRGKELYHPLRLALTGKDSGIELKHLFDIMEEGSMLNTDPAVPGISERLEAVIK